MVLMIHLDFNDTDPGYILYEINNEDLDKARYCALLAKEKWLAGRSGKSIDELIEDEFNDNSITYESLNYDVLSLYMF